jgi:UDP-N-acetylmuramate dehydrogenase
VRSVDELREALSSTHAEHGVLLLGGGSNLVVSDDGFDGLVIQIGLEGVVEHRPGEITVQAGEPWENVVEYSVRREWAGIECLAGIPGSAGATPIQNVGAYGQEVANVISGVDTIEIATGNARHWTPEDCGFSYRDSRFKRQRDRWLVTAVHFSLDPGGESTVTYAGLKRALEGQDPTLAAVRDAVVRLRRQKSMVLDEHDPDARSVGSFFTNPIVDAEQAEGLVEHALRTGIVERADDVPRFDAAGGRIKFPAAWLIERAGIAKGTRRGGVGVSSKHTLALVHHGGGTTAELLALAREIRARVLDEFGVTLEAEPRLVGVSLDK